MPKKIVVIEDEPDIIGLVTLYLEKEGYRVTAVRDGVKGFQHLRTEPPDLLILDIMLPEMDGLEICRRVRADSKTAALPIIMLTAKGEESDKIVGLELGADDYLVKPFSPKELVARVKALLRRAERREAAPDRYVYGDLVLDPVRHEVRLKGLEIVLTAKEFGLLERLLKECGRVLTRDALLDKVWGYDADVISRTVDVHIRRLREKIPLLKDRIQTVKPFGYKLKEEP
ncbi:MAG: response regulator transcription factor [Nitrospirae bacterium]|nr:response regulator transcription factor [Nitrospirota bacterium]